MPERFGERLAGLGIPHPCGLVPRSCDHPPPIRAELGRLDTLFMPERFGHGQTKATKSQRGKKSLGRHPTRPVTAQDIGQKGHGTSRIIRREEIFSSENLHLGQSLLGAFPLGLCLRFRLGLGFGLQLGFRFRLHRAGALAIGPKGQADAHHGGQAQ